MKITTEAHIRKLINTEVFEAIDGLRKELYGTLASRDKADRLKMNEPVAVELYPTTSELAAAFNRGYKAARKAAEAYYQSNPAPTPLYRTNEELNFAAGVRQGRKEGHSSAIDAVLVLIRNAPSYTPNATLAAAIRKLEP